jgi:hypothetical protein
MSLLGECSRPVICSRTRLTPYYRCSAFFLVMAYFYFPETRRKTLEEIAEAFGDKVVLADERDVMEEAEAERKLSVTEEKRVEHAA